MKTLLLIAICLLPLISNCQQRSEVPFKGAKKIIITDTLSANSNFRSIGFKLNDLTFYIDRKDSEFKTLISMPIIVEIGELGNGVERCFQTIYIVAKDHQIIITSKSISDRTYKILGAYQGDASADVVEWNKKDMTKALFANMMKIVSDIPNSKVEYAQ